MPTVHKSDLLQVVQQLWGESRAPVEDQAKYVLAEALIRQAWGENNRAGIELNVAGGDIKAALGDAWISASERKAAGKPSLHQILTDDPYFLVKPEPGYKQPLIKLRISRLSKLIGNPELIAEYRSPADSYTSSSGEGEQQAVPQQRGATLNDEGLPIRPGKKACPHYTKFGWCLFKADCWFSHPSLSPSHPPTRGGKPDSREVLYESDKEPGLMLINGVYPVRPDKKPCGFYISNGWCMFKTKCRLHHPLPSELAALQSAAGSSGPVGRVSPGSDDISNTEEAPMVKQPPVQVLLGVIIDSVFPQRESPAACARGALAKHIVEQMAEQVQASLLDPDAEITVPGPTAGSYLSQWWAKQRFYDPGTRPWKSTGLATMLEGHHLFWANRASDEPNTFTLRLGQLITEGAKAASKSLAAMSDAVWPPTSGKEAWLRGNLAKWLLQAGFEGNNGEVLRQVLQVGPESPTVFRIDVAQAGEYLRRSWASQPHPYDSSSPPWTQLKPLIAGDRFFYIEPAPGKATSQHVTLDLLDMLRQLPRIARGGNARGLQQGAITNGAAAAAGAGAQERGRSGASSSGGGYEPAGPSSSSRRVSSMGGDALDFGEDDEYGGVQGAAAGALDPYVMEGTSAAAAGGGSGGGGANGSLGGTAAAATGSSGIGHADAQRLARLEADVAALEGLRYSPPSQGIGPHKLQRWWPPGQAQVQGFTWTEVAVRLLSPDAHDAALRVAEMVQHLEISPVLGVACSVYAQRPHLLQFFAPYASIGGLEMPAAVYLLDFHKSGEDVRNYLSLIGPVLSSRDNIKVCHSSKQWSGLLYNFTRCRLDNYYDTQQANYVWKALQRASGRRHLADADLQRTTEVSLTALLDNCGFHHPVRHNPPPDGSKLQWQNRPLTNELITCAAADVAYLIPVMETQVRSLRVAAAEVRQQFSQQRRAALMAGLPDDIGGTSVLESLATGVEGQQRGGLSLQRLGEWAGLSTFRQEPWHPIVQ